MTCNQPHERRVGDTAKVYSAVLMYKDVDHQDVPKSLSGLEVTFTMVNAATGVVKVDQAEAEVVYEDEGVVRYDFQDEDVDTPGVYWTTFRVIESGEADSYPVSPHEGVIWIHSNTQTAEEVYAAAR